MFHNRLDAAQQLLEKLQRYRGEDPLVLAIPRGAVPMGRSIALGLGGALDVVLVRKLRAPLQPELAIGAIDENGWTYLTEHATHQEVSADYIATEKLFQLQTLRARRAQQPARLVCAVPVAPPAAATKIRPLVDEFVCLEVSANFHSVGQFYANFAQVEDAEVIALLQSSTSAPSYRS